MSSVNELHWAAGFMEGEGTWGFRGLTVRAEATQKQLAPLQRLHEIFGGAIYSTPDKRTGKVYFKWCAHSSRAVGVIMTLYGLMSPRRKEQARRALDAWKSYKPANRYRTHCPQGHEYTQENTKRWNGSRFCRACSTEAVKEHRANKRAAIA